MSSFPPPGVTAADGSAQPSIPDIPDNPHDPNSSSYALTGRTTLFFIDFDTPPDTLEACQLGFNHMHRRTLLALSAVAAVTITTNCFAAPPGPPRVLHHHAKHPSAPDASRFVTNRDVPPLPLPSEDNAFFFVVFGDRTEGNPAGVNILAQAVEDTNLLEPDFVMTVGDLVQGYNAQHEWISEMREFKGVMDGLLCPWFPVAGNHDIYWRGPNRPAGEHEANYEMHFGPLWYAFKHKDCWFIVLYSDEGDPVTGEKRFDRPENQRMSDEQFSWLTETLHRTAEAQHVFVFLHHPRWLGGGYGDDWDRVHELLTRNGNVRAVFAGHIHRMRYDGPIDGIEYVTLATTGGSQSGAVPQAGYLHHFHVVTVRPRQIALAALPVGEVMDVRAITGQVSDETKQLASMTPVVTQPVELRADGSADSELKVAFGNPTSRPIEIFLAPDSADPRWRFAPDHLHLTLETGQTAEFTFGVRRPAESIDDALALISMNHQIDYLAKGYRYAIPESASTLPIIADLPAPQRPESERALSLDGDGDYLEIPDRVIDVPDGPLTLECWFNARSFADRVGVVAKTESSDYGLFASKGVPSFSIFIEDEYAQVYPESPMLQTDTWHHLAGVYDGSEVRLYLDGKRIAAVEREGRRRQNRLPLLIGADIDGRGNAVSHFDGLIDAVRVSASARYDDDFEPDRRFEPDDDTRLLFNMDGRIGPWIHEASRNAHGVIHDNAHLIDEQQEDEAEE